MVQYLLEQMSARSALESLYTGISISGLDADRGTATLSVGSASVGIPAALLTTPRPELHRFISKTDTVEIGTAICEAVGWHICAEFVTARKHLPIYSSIHGKVEEKTSGGRSWILAHALQIQQRDVHGVATAAYSHLLDQFSSPQTVETRLEDVLREPWILTEAQSVELLRMAAAFQLLPSTAQPKHGGGAAFLIAGITPVWFPLRDRCFLAIICAAIPDAVWSARPDINFRHAAVQD